MKQVFIDSGGFLALLVPQALRDSGVRVERVRRVDEEGAETLVRMHEDKDYSLCDALSFVVMERLGIGEAVAYDRHFRQYGRFRVL